MSSASDLAAFYKIICDSRGETSPALPVSSTPLPPWLHWLTLALLRQHERQFWHRRIVEKILMSQNRDADDEGDGEGPIPDMPGWSYGFHGNGCCLKSPDGELIDVDANEGGPAMIDPWFFANRITSIHTHTHTLESHLWRWLPSDKLIVATLEDLRAAAIIEYPHGNHIFKLAAPLARVASQIATQDFADAPTTARWKRALGDTDDTPARNTAYQAYLASHFADRKRAQALLPIAPKLIPAKNLRAHCLKLLEGDIDPATGAAIETLRQVPDSETDRAVRALITRISPEKHFPYPAFQAVAYLLERRVAPDETLAHFRRFASVEKAVGFIGNPFLGDYAQLALEHVAEDAMALIRRALRGNVPISVHDIAALLSEIDQPWCHRELLSALELPQHRSRAYLIAALRRSKNPAVRQAAVAHDKPPVRTEGQIGYTYEEVLHNSVDTLFDGPIEKNARLFADRMRARFPDNWDGTDTQ